MYDFSTFDNAELVAHYDASVDEPDLVRKQVKARYVHGCPEDYLTALEREMHSRGLNKEMQDVSDQHELADLLDLCEGRCQMQDAADERAFFNNPRNFGQDREEDQEGYEFTNDRGETFGF